MDGMEHGAIVSSASGGGIVMLSNSGDFAEWHEQLDTAEDLVEGTVVGFCEGKVGMNTSQAHILGVVSARAAVAGSVPNDTESRHGGVCVAYCGACARAIRLACASVSTVVLR